MLLINEIFPSIQGESTFQGFPTVFIRLTGCNLRCSYCDTQYALNSGKELEISSILDMACSFGIKHVCITGGEPLIQNETPELASFLLKAGKVVSVETNGSKDVSVLEPEIKAVIDIKCPGSAMPGKTFMDNVLAPRPYDEFKFVLTGRDDFDYASDFIKRFNLAQKNTVLFSPVKDFLEPSKLAGWIVNELPEVRLNLQIHKYIWDGIHEKESVNYFRKKPV